MYKGAKNPKDAKKYCRIFAMGVPIIRGAKYSSWYCLDVTLWALRAVDNFYSLGGGGGGGGGAQYFFMTLWSNFSLINLPCTYKPTCSHSSSQLDLNHIMHACAGYIYHTLIKLWLAGWLHVLALE